MKIIETESKNILVRTRMKGNFRQAKMKRGYIE